MTYCVVPRDTDPDIVEALRVEYASDPWTSVVLDGRDGEEEPTSAVLMQRRPILRSTLEGSMIPGVRLERHMPPVTVSLAELSESEIISRVLQQDPAAATELRWRCYAQVLVLLTARIGNRMEAHAIVPSVMDAMHEALPTYNRRTDFARWLRTFIANMPLEQRDD